MKLRSLLVVGGLVAASFALPAKANAALITGEFSFTLGHVTSTANPGLIDFLPNSDGIHAVPPGPGTYGMFDVQAGSLRTGSFTLPQFGTSPDLLTNFIHDMASTPGANFVPLGPGSTPEFFVFSDFPTWNFTETFLAQGETIGGNPSPYFFNEVCIPTRGCSTSVAIGLAGIAWDDTTPSLVSNWIALLSADFTGETKASLIEKFVSGGGLPDHAWSGHFEANATAVPEPATLLTFGLGSLYLARRRRNQKKS